jgi:GNAT superfamily N-acetyltransferase
MENKVVGMALYYYGFSTWKGRSLHLEDLIVNENYRKLGIGKALDEPSASNSQDRKSRAHELGSAGLEHTRYRIL